MSINNKISKFHKDQITDNELLAIKYLWLPVSHCIIAICTNTYNTSTSMYTYHTMFVICSNHIIFYSSKASAHC